VNLQLKLEIISTIAKVLAAIGTFIVAILAIWGDKIRARLAAPKLKLALHDPGGDLTVRGNQRKAIYYHIELTNERTWSPAKRVRVLLTGIEKRRPNGTFSPEPLMIPLQLAWAFSLRFPQFHELLPTIGTARICDLGFLDEGAERFTLSPYVVPNNFRGYVSAGESMRVSLVASGDNYESRSPLCLEISWDGKWSSDSDEMQRHLVIKEVRER